MNAAEQSHTHRTVTIVVPAAQDRVFGFLADPQNLPVWATEFCQELKWDGAHCKIVTSGGELFFRIEADPKTGVIDMFSGPTAAEQDIFPCRAIALSGQVTAISFTFFRTPGIHDEMYERQYESLLIEMDGLAERFSAVR